MGLDPWVVQHPEVLMILRVNDAFFDAHLVKLFKITLRPLWFALLVHFPGGCDFASVFLIFFIGSSESETIRG